MCEKATVFEVNKKYKTRDGRDARVICVDAKSEHPIVALIKDGNVAEYVVSKDKNGEYRGSKSQSDLMPPMRTVYATFKEDGTAFWNEDRLGCDGVGIIATAIPVEIPA